MTTTTNRKWINNLFDSLLTKVIEAALDRLSQRLA